MVSIGKAIDAAIRLILSVFSVFLSYLLIFSGAFYVCSIKTENLQ